METPKVSFEMNLEKLPYTNGEQIFAKSFKTALQGLRLLTKTSPISTSECNGAITVWFGTDKKWHANVCRYQQVINEQAGLTKASLLNWLEAALELIK